MTVISRGFQAGHSCRLRRAVLSGRVRSPRTQPLPCLHWSAMFLCVVGVIAHPLLSKGLLWSWKQDLANVLKWRSQRKTSNFPKSGVSQSPSIYVGFLILFLID